jgi:hypothetical protein
MISVIPNGTCHSERDLSFRTGLVILNEVKNLATEHIAFSPAVARCFAPILAFARKHGAQHDSKTPGALLQFV